MIELHEAIIEGHVVNTSFTITDEKGTADVPKFPIPVKKLLHYIAYNQLNIFVTDESTGDYEAMDVNTYLADNLDSVVLAYLMEEGEGL